MTNPVTVTLRTEPVERELAERLCTHFTDDMYVAEVHKYKNKDLYYVLAKKVIKEV